MRDFQSILQEIKDTGDLQPNKQPEKQEKQKAKSAKKDPSMPFSQSEMEALSEEMMHHSAAYEEPEFHEVKVVAPQKTEPPKQKPRETKSDEMRAVLDRLDTMSHALQKIEARLDVGEMHHAEANSLKIEESAQPLEIVKLLIAEAGATQNTKYLLQTREGVREIALQTYYDMSKFVSMLQQYRYSMTLDKTTVFENSAFNLYKEKLTIISQNVLANSFLFFAKSSILDETIGLGQSLKVESPFISKAIDEIEQMLGETKEALGLSEYQKSFYFAKHLNGMGYILNAITIISEMLGEYLVASARGLSIYSDERIQRYLDKIELSRSTRKAYYKLHSSAKDFFTSHFLEQGHYGETTFFPFKDSGNEEIETQMKKRYQANKGNKSGLFHSYADLIEKVRWIRNDLAHGNNSRAYQDITADINEVLVDFEYLAIHKGFLNG